MATQLDSAVLERGVSGDGAHSDMSMEVPTESLEPQHGEVLKSTHSGATLSWVRIPISHYYLAI